MSTIGVPPSLRMLGEGHRLLLFLMLNRRENLSQIEILLNLIQLGEVQDQFMFDLNLIRTRFEFNSKKLSILIQLGLESKSNLDY